MYVTVALHRKLKRNVQIAGQIEPATTYPQACWINYADSRQPVNDSS